MKYMNMKKKYQPLNLQFFAEGGDGGNGDDSGDDEGDDQDDDSDEGGDDDSDEKKYSQKEVDDAVKKRLAREKRKWQREQQKKKDKPDGKGRADDDGGDESEDSKARKAAESRASKAEAKVACYEAGVAKDSVDDVTALARAYMDADEDMDLEEAIEKVVKKYPHFKKDSAGPDEEGEEKGKAWGQRQKGKGPGKMSGVEKRFYELNPDLKK